MLAHLSQGEVVEGTLMTSDQRTEGVDIATPIARPVEDPSMLARAPTP